MTTGVTTRGLNHRVRIGLIGILAGLMLLWCSPPTFAAAGQKRTPSEPITTNIDNIEHEMISIDGTKVSTKANGKPKILFFFNFGCALCKATEGDLIDYGINTDDVDFIMAEASYGGTNQEEAVDFYKGLAQDGLNPSKKCYNCVDVCWDYLRACGYIDDGTKKPVIVYISADNKIMGFSWYYTNVYKNAKQFGINLEPRDCIWEDAPEYKYCAMCGDRKDKPAQEVAMKGVSRTFKASALRAKARSFTLKTPEAKGNVSFKKVNGSTRLKLTKDGKVTVKTGTKKGTYRIKVQAKATATSEYAPGTSNRVTITVHVK